MSRSLSVKNIEDVKVGDKVLSWNNGRIEANVVTKVFHHPAEQAEMYLIINNGLLKVTKEHLMYVNERWIPAGAIKLGDRLKNLAFEDMVVKSIQKVYRYVKTYNLEVANAHTYFANGILVHNLKCLWDLDPVDSAAIIFGLRKVESLGNCPSPCGSGGTCADSLCGEGQCTAVTSPLRDTDNIKGNQASQPNIVVFESAGETPLFKKAVKDIEVKPKINKIKLAQEEIVSPETGDTTALVYTSSGVISYSEASIDVEKQAYDLPVTSPRTSGNTPFVIYRYVDRSDEQHPEVVRMMIVAPDVPNYGMLSPEKIKALIYIPYEKFKEALGIGEGYDVAVRIVNNEGRELLFYGKNYQDADILVSFSRAVLIYPDYLNNIKEVQKATLTVYVFK